MTRLYRDAVTWSILSVAIVVCILGPKGHQALEVNIRRTTVVRFSPDQMEPVNVGDAVEVELEVIASGEADINIRCMSHDASVFVISSQYQSRNTSLTEEERVRWSLSMAANTSIVVVTPGYQNGSALPSAKPLQLVRVQMALRAEAFGRGYLLCDVHARNSTLRRVKYYITVIRSQGIELILFKIVVNIIIVVINLAMGCELDIRVVKESFSRPIAPLIGLFCQFLCMPMISLTIIYLFSLEGAFAFGLFTIGCAPGGGNSNFLTYIFGGNVSLSITMTFVSNLGAIVMMPIWLMSLGNRFLNGPGNEVELGGVDTFGLGSDITGVQIPFRFIMISILMNTGPLCLGVAIAKYRNSLASKIRRILKPFLIFTLTFFLVAGMYIHHEILMMITWHKVLICILLPYSGFFIGMLLSKLSCRVYADVICISLETGIQNMGVAIVICVNTLPHPEEEYALLALLIIALLSPIPMYILIFIVKLREKLLAIRGDQLTIEDETDSTKKYALVDVVEPEDCKIALDEQRVVL